MAAG
ncbi:hypothetical protein YPPY101_1497, partial [Yersinia pestis PY-101]|jgi:hypothetical protein